MTPRSTHASRWALVGAALLATAALAQPAMDAATHFDRGVAFFNGGDYARALSEFDAAYAMAPRFQVLFNIGATERKLSESLHALHAFERYLRDGGAEVPAARRQVVERELEELHALVGTLVIRVEGASADIQVDHSNAGRSPLAGPVYVEPGAHHVRVLRDGHPVGEREVSVGPGAREELSFAEAFAKVEVRSPPAWIPEAAKTVPSRRIAPYVVWGSAGLAGTISGSFALWGLQQKGQLDQLTSGSNPVPANQAANLRDSSNQAFSAAAVAGGAALVLTGIGGYLAWRHRESPP